MGGSYRLIDVPMSNCINSGINKVYILTQFNSASLNRHLARAYNFGSGTTFGDGYVEVHFFLDLITISVKNNGNLSWYESKRF
jgi:ADP-glucose pyrophosphorylase